MLSWIAKTAFGAAVSRLKWWIIAAAFSAVLGWAGVQTVRLKMAAADLRACTIELTSAREANSTNMATITELRTANEGFAAQLKANAVRVAQLEKDAENARLDATRTRAELSARRQRDREAPACADLLDRSLSVCPDVPVRLRELEAALDAH